MQTSTLLNPPPAITPEVALFLDFDGTLAPLQDDPDSVHLSGRQLACIETIAQSLDQALAIVSGRDVRDLSKRVPKTVWRAGSHGLEICAPGDLADFDASSAPPSLVASIQGLCDSIPGTRLEQKGEVLAVHYRFAQEAEARLKSGMAEVLKPYPTYKLQAGKLVMEAKPVTANKGAALETFMSFSGFAGRIPVMVGDDTTDEDAMAVVNKRGGWAVKIGDGPTEARYRLSTPEDTWNWLSKGCL